MKELSRDVLCIENVKKGKKEREVMGGKALNMLIIICRSTYTCKQRDTLFVQGCFVLEEQGRMKVGEQAWNAAAVRGQGEESTKSRTLPECQSQVWS